MHTRRQSAAATRQDYQDLIAQATERLRRPQPADLPVIEEMVRETMRQLGGPAAFASEMAGIIKDESTPKDTKRRMMEMLCYLIRYIEEHKGGQDDLSLVDEKELIGLAKECFAEEMALAGPVQHTPGRAVSAPPAFAECGFDGFGI